jgi:hypothetical protein
LGLLTPDSLRNIPVKDLKDHLRSLLCEWDIKYQNESINYVSKGEGILFGAASITFIGWLIIKNVPIAAAL